MNDNTTNNTTTGQEPDPISVWVAESGVGATCWLVPSPGDGPRTTYDISEAYTADTKAEVLDFITSGTSSLYYPVRYVRHGDELRSPVEFNDDDELEFTFTTDEQMQEFFGEDWQGV